MAISILLEIDDQLADFGETMGNHTSSKAILSWGSYQPPTREPSLIVEQSPSLEGWLNAQFQGCFQKP